MARAHRLSGLRGLRGYQRVVLGDDGDIDWGSIISNSITTAGQVAQVALKPPTYSAVTLPSGATSVTSYAPIGSSTASALLGTSSVLNNPYVILGGLALVAVLLMKQ